MNGFKNVDGLIDELLLLREASNLLDKIWVELFLRGYELPNELASDLDRHREKVCRLNK